MDENERQTHVNGCLDAGSSEQGDTSVIDNDERDFDYSEQTYQAAGQREDDNSVEVGWDGPARPGGWSDWVNRKVDRGDRWWDPIDGPLNRSDILSNYSPGIIPVLAQILTSAVHQRITRSAVLSRPLVHIKGAWDFDMGWGCGYRNALMALSALLVSQPAYRLLFSREIIGSDPGVRRIQGWIEEGWGNGYDRVGRGQLKGKVLGTRKWIGTSDLYAMFSARGIPCELYDFPKPKAGSGGPRTAHIALQQWVKDYFAEDAITNGLTSSHVRLKPRSAFDVMMRTDQDGIERGEAVRLSTRYPLILQHSGHSRTIIGYEENAAGSINLLLLDPGKTMPKDIRTAGIEELPRQRQQPYRPPIPTSKSSHDSLPFSHPYTNGASEIVRFPDDAVTVAGNGSASSNATDEEVDKGGWVRKKVDKVFSRKDSDRNASPRPWDGQVSKSLGYFRANLGALG